MLSAASYGSWSLFKHILFCSSTHSSVQYFEDDIKNEEIKLTAEILVGGNDEK